MTAAAQTPREAAADAFLRMSGWAAARRTPLANDASPRRYARLSLGARRAVLMDADPATGEDVAGFAALTRMLRAAGASAPEVFAQDTAAGFLLLEDLGDALFARHLLRHPKDEATLYAAAIDVLAGWAGQPALAQGLPPYDAAAYRREVALLTDWYLPAATGTATPAGLRGAVLAAIEAALERLAPAPPVFVHRDFHAENLFWLPDRPGTAAIGLIDYQDALAGHPAYDLVSLLEDARRDTAPGLALAMADRYAGRTGCERDRLREAIAVIGAQRNMKILGIFARLARRDGKPAYIAHMPRVWRHLQHDLAHPALAALAALVAAHVPPPEDAVRARIARPA